VHFLYFRGKYYKVAAEQSTRVLAMLMLQLLYDNKKRKTVILIVSSRLHLPCRKAATAVLERQAQLNYPSNHDVKTLCKQDRLRDALRILKIKDYPLQSSTYVYLLQGCIKKALSDGKLVHAHINGSGFRVEIYLQNTIVNMYAKCGSLADARRAFNQMPERDAFSWTVMIAAYSRHGFAEEALALFNLM
jgi:pentatricopeptide repeat protein